MTAFDKNLKEISDPRASATEWKEKTVSRQSPHSKKTEKWTKLVDGRTAYTCARIGNSFGFLSEVVIFFYSLDYKPQYLKMFVTKRLKSLTSPENSVISGNPSKLIFPKLPVPLFKLPDRKKWPDFPIRAQVPVVIPNSGVPNRLRLWHSFFEILRHW